ncbi:hypothetical protein A1Q1_07650 [Trichosporon asahii var. asahii CBS 2479]|uniref:Uncharacterized protein n=1 Tax=Trichosporon asahii var. asahii (strain ATCC 90039 / CBS 2479 / JCM 2466 / KCTC 7840 / NBRC 103889/ NCYC 2677 / UAMH 7654) TaxID=1186058 RepID=J5TJ87_TRIAS|nr:hypothetical protein A1Q1_07650 [Trichosporon asahii var. asahii CBS 2479]EJT51186.1 hypothetical protein A1Q1_07650 [Trichosporon asahii var. asahii CBS 2479]
MAANQAERAAETGQTAPQAAHEAAHDRPRSPPSPAPAAQAAEETRRPLLRHLPPRAPAVDARDAEADAIAIHVGRAQLQADWMAPQHILQPTRTPLAPIPEGDETQAPAAGQQNEQEGLLQDPGYDHDDQALPDYYNPADVCEDIPVAPPYNAPPPEDFADYLREAAAARHGRLALHPGYNAGVHGQYVPLGGWALPDPAAVALLLRAPPAPNYTAWNGGLHHYHGQNGGLPGQQAAPGLFAGLQNLPVPNVGPCPVHPNVHPRRLPQDGQQLIQWLRQLRQRRAANNGRYGQNQDHAQQTEETRPVQNEDENGGDEAEVEMALVDDCSEQEADN